MPAVQALLQSALLKSWKFRAGGRGSWRMFNFCYLHVQWCQKGCSRSVVMSKRAINFKNKPDPSTPKLNWRQQPFRCTFQIYKPSFIPQEVTTKKKHGTFVWQIPERSLTCMLAVLLHEPYREVKHYTVPTQRQWMIWRACHKLRSGTEQILGKPLILKTEFKLRFSHTWATSWVNSCLSRPSKGSMCRVLY